MKISVSARHALAVFIAALVLAAVRTYIVVNMLELTVYEVNEYYLPDGLITRLFAVTVVICCLAFALLSLLTMRKKTAETAEKSQFVSFFTVIAALVVLGTVINSFTTAISDTAKLFSNIGVGQTLKLLVKDYGLIVLICGLACSICMFIMARHMRKDPPNRNALAGHNLALIVFSGVRLLFAFIVHRSTPSVSSGAYNILALAATLLFFVCDGKAFIKKGSAALYTCFGYIAVILTLVYSVPDLWIHLFGPLSFDVEASGALVSIIFALLIVTKLAALPEELDELTKE